MAYIIVAGRAIKSEYIAIGTILSAASLLAYTIHRANKRAQQRLAGDPPIYAKSPEEEAFIRNKLEAFKQEQKVLKK
ncbi:hypothetical protein PNEG_03077 [Pneumocystis murina B123]|uniref:Uncharacterized protein n=1 Tax=Pneumocystis murina (strain B123) TaxID=1069680 RepID=M7NNA6_PNEMU|nr:hypothetical protein PNEG_03077 [Pneumocystis murina B123]EMR08601.1 hypothetical protein PNEG_03077 [Pneumocystis murina B123]